MLVKVDMHQQLIHNMSSRLPVSIVFFRWFLYALVYCIALFVISVNSLGAGRHTFSDHWATYKTKSNSFLMNAQNINPLDRWEGVRGQKELSLCHRRKRKASTGSVWSCTWPWVLRNFMFLPHSSILLDYCGIQSITCRKDIKIQFEDRHIRQ